ncbi:hypothetical protein DFH06DRAFT_1179148 [Mycena polygramma]|nr:hypothetical protein DFH06DRAFT_1179148 [Mycena polygramma]
MISELCVELLQEIGSHTRTADQKSLRAVSRHFRSIIEPLFCASTTLVLNLKQDLDSGPSQVDTLAAGTTPWSLCRRLRINSLRAPKYRQMSLRNEPMHNLLRSALESLTRLHAVCWTLRSGDTAWARTLVIDVLNSCDSFSELTLLTEMSSHKFPALPPVSGIRMLIIDPTPATWKHLGSGLLSWVEEIIASSPGLECLCLPGEGYADIAQVLEETDIQLKNIYIPRPRVYGSSTDLVPILRYLASYSGLERLEIQSIATELEGTLLFESVLPRHLQSLVALSCPGQMDGRCSFGLHTISLVSQLRNLETLEMSVNSSEMAPSNMVEQFLEMAVGLPALRNIALVAPTHAGFWTANLPGNWQDKITSTMLACDKAKASPAVALLVESHRQRMASIEKRQMFWFQKWS